jgi:peptide/nickel transport system permease protein
MGRYLIQRLVIAVLTLLGISLVLFTLLALAPGNPLGELASNPAIPEAVRDNLRKSFGLDQPLLVRYLKWLRALLQGDLGYSFTSRSPVRELIAQRLPTTLGLMGSAYLLSSLIAIPLGILAAVKQNSWLDRSITSLSLLGFSLPTFVTGLIFIWIFTVQWRWFPFVYSSTLQVTNAASLGEQMRQLILPVSVLVLYQCTTLLRFVRAAVLEELPQPYIRTAYAKGLASRTVIGQHLLRNAMIPLVTLVALDIPAVFTGALVTEQVFRVPGMGALMVDSIYRSDTPVVMAITFIYAILVVIFSTLADLIYGCLDPRIQYHD